MDQIICSWSTYKGNHCKKIISICDNVKQSIRFCPLHRELMAEYLRLKEDELCETFKEIKIVPRSNKHLKTVMNSLENEDDKVDVYMAGGSIEEADISNIDYIVLDSDSSRFYYNPKRGQKKAKDLKIILREHCRNNSVVSFDNIKYCEDCYKKCMKDSPRISLII
jgi:hypothetical protein